MTSPSPEQRFSDRVENYVRYRPGYPPELLQLLESGLSPQSVIADIVDKNGDSAAEGGFLVIRKPWPSMMRTMQMTPR